MHVHLCARTCAAVVRSNFVCVSVCVCLCTAAEEAGASLFLEPILWMADAVVGAVQGKLYCPGCNARLGSFNWSGRVACSTG